MEDHILLKKISEPESRNYGFNLLVRKYQEKIYWHVRKMVIDHDDANDITQDIFIKIYKHIDKFRADAQLYTWIYRIATNECLGFLKKRKRALFFSVNDIHTELEQKLDNSSHISGDEIQLNLQKALLTLPDKQRLVFNMKYFDEMKFEEMSKITKTSVGALKASYHLAVKKIEKFINEN